MSDFNDALIADLRANDGQPSGGPFVGRQMIILTTTGAKSGDEREAPLVYSTDGDDIIVIASMGGAPSHPSWYHNIVADPRVTIEVGGVRSGAHATMADDAERRRLYDRHAELHPSFTEYEARTGGRVIPVVILRREASSVAA